MPPFLKIMSSSLRVDIPMHPRSHITDSGTKASNALSEAVHKAAVRRIPVCRIATGTVPSIKTAIWVSALFVHARSGISLWNITPTVFCRCAMVDSNKSYTMSISFKKFVPQLLHDPPSGPPEQLEQLDQAEEMMLRNNLGAAEKLLLSMLEDDHECIPVLSNLGHLYGRHLSEFETAIEYYDRVLLLEPDNAWARDARRRYLRYI